MCPTRRLVFRFHTKREASARELLSSPAGPRADGIGTVIAESGVPESTIARLEALGHRLRRGPSVGGYQGILIDHQHQTLHGATESRKDGAAVGY